MKPELITIADLINLIETPPPEETVALRRKLDNAAKHIKELKLVDPMLPARHWYQYVRTAELLTAVPEIKLEIGGGTPAQRSRIGYSPKLKALAAHNGIAVHRWGRKAFALAKPPFDKRPPRRRLAAELAS